MLLEDDAMNELLDEAGITLDITHYHAPVKPLLDALIVGGPPATVRHATDDAVAAIWDDKVKAALHKQLTAMQRDGAAGFDDDRAHAVATLLSEMERPAAENRLAYALIWRAVADAIARVKRNHRRVTELEETLAHTPTKRHRELTLPLAAMVRMGAGVGVEEAVMAIMQTMLELGLDPATEPPPGEFATALACTLATHGRRRMMRDDLTHLAAVLADDHPHVATALIYLLDEPVPGDPAHDGLWMHLVAVVIEEDMDTALFAFTTD